MSQELFFNKYIIEVERYTYTYDIEKITMYEGSVLSLMQRLFDAVKDKQGRDTISVTLRNVDGTVYDSFTGNR